jgi:hypothetical protein
MGYSSHDLLLAPEKEFIREILQAIGLYPRASHRPKFFPLKIALAISRRCRLNNTCIIFNLPQIKRGDGIIKQAG